MHKSIKMISTVMYTQYILIVLANFLLFWLNTKTKHNLWNE